MTDSRNRNEERRNAQRFELNWEAAVQGTDQTGSNFNEAATLRNLSSHGAFFYLCRIVTPGERLELQVKIPFRSNNRMTYRAQVVRVDETGVSGGVAVMFDSARPVFIQR